MLIIRGVSVTNKVATECWFVIKELRNCSEDKGVAEDEPEDKEVKDSEDESSEEDTLRVIDSSEEEKEADSDSLKDFIVEDEEQKDGQEEEEAGEIENKDFRSHLPRQCKIF